MRGESEHHWPVRDRREQENGHRPSMIFQEWIINEAELSLVPSLINAGGRSFAGKLLKYFSAKANQGCMQ